MPVSRPVEPDGEYCPLYSARNELSQLALLDGAVRPDPFAASIGELYLADLFGASTGCVMSVVLLEALVRRARSMASATATKLRVMPK